MLVYQFCSSQEIGFVKYKPDTPGYFTWMRSWFALQKSEYERFAWGPSGWGRPGMEKDWPGFDVANYPARAFDSAAERDRVSDLLRIWHSGGYTTSVDRGFMDIGYDRFAQHPVRSFILVPSLRMAHLWINLDGAQPYIRVLLIQRPLSTFIVAFALLLRLILIFMAVLGAYAIWFQLRTLATDYLPLARFASLFVALRTMELGALGALTWGGLMESRYVIVAFPFMIILSFWGFRFCIEKRTAPSIAQNTPAEVIFSSTR
jgi:hypothetical protein